MCCRRRRFKVSEVSQGQRHIRILKHIRIQQSVCEYQKIKDLFEYSKAYSNRSKKEFKRHIRIQQSLFEYEKQQVKGSIRIQQLLFEYTQAKLIRIQQGSIRISEVKVQRRYSNTHTSCSNTSSHSRSEGRASKRGGICVIGTRIQGQFARHEEYKTLFLTERRKRLIHSNRKGEKPLIHEKSTFSVLSKRMKNFLSAFSITVL